MKINEIIQGDALAVLKTLPDQSVDMCITSPPYWALRDYGVPGQLGLESTFQEYINKLCDIFDEVKRVLKDTGTCWVNMGDTYSATRWSENLGTSFMTKGKNSKKNHVIEKVTGMPNKTLVQIPSRFAIEMANRGWILRNEIIWHKPNCMPASVTDRFTIDFEKMFFFVKQQKYYFEQQFEPYADTTLPRMNRGVSDKHKNINGAPGQTPHSMSQPRLNKKNWQKGMGGGGTKFSGHSGYYDDEGNFIGNPKGRNKRAVWRISPRAYREAHFAVYPPELIETPIRAGCPGGGSGA